METRELRYFVAVAEELSFGRAAQRLGIAQPPLSRAIARIERRLGASLFDRGSRSITLTDVGAVLLRQARPALDAVAAAENVTRRAAQAGGEPAVVLATKASASSELLAKLLDAYAAEPGAARVEVELCDPGEAEELVRDGRADVAILHLVQPWTAPAGVDVEVLRTEGQVAVLPAGHPLTTRPTLHLADVTDLPDLPQARWRRRDGTYAEGPGPTVRSHTHLLQLVSLGRALLVAPESVREQLGDDVVAVPLVDTPPVSTLIAWPAHSTSRAVADLVRTATRL